MVWDDGVAASAQNWANQCTFGHSYGAYGENLSEFWSGLGERRGPSQIVQRAFSIWCSRFGPLAAAVCGLNAHILQYACTGPQTGA